MAGPAPASIEHAPGVATIEMGARPHVPGLGRFLSVDGAAGVPSDTPADRPRAGVS